MCTLPNDVAIRRDEEGDGGCVLSPTVFLLQGRQGFTMLSNGGKGNSKDLQAYNSLVDFV